jgi:FkbM family methyltransferase
MQLRGGVLVDVGAGQGFFSLAAAARGHRVIAFEASPASLAAFKASVKYNGFQDLVTVHSTAVGASAAALCLQQTDRRGCPATAAAAKLAGIIQSSHANDTRDGNRQHVQQEVQAALADMQLRRRRGYPWLADGADLPPTHPCCRAIGRRVPLSDVLQNVTDVAALRISAHGHEGFVLQGALDYLRTVHKPDVVYVEFWPASLKAAGSQQPGALLDTLFGLGYTSIAHAGRVCDERWQNATQDLHLQVSFSPWV